jgi:7,8-dihydroneopterin aldolase/epimerase/oxygenase
MTAPVIDILGLEVFAHHGVHEFERRDGQTFRFDVRLRPSSAAAGAGDDLADAVDYGAVADRVVEIASGGPYSLLERLATVIADDLLRSFAVDYVRLRVHKPQAPIPHPFRDVTVTVERGMPGG